MLHTEASFILSYTNRSNDAGILYIAIIAYHCVRVTEVGRGGVGEKYSSIILN